MRLVGRREFASARPSVRRHLATLVDGRESRRAARTAIAAGARLLVARRATEKPPLAGRAAAAGGRRAPSLRGPLRQLASSVALVVVFLGACGSVVVVVERRRRHRCLTTTPTSGRQARAAAGTPFAVVRECRALLMGGVRAAERWCECAALIGRPKAETMAVCVCAVAARCRVFSLALPQDSSQHPRCWMNT